MAHAQKVFAGLLLVVLASATVAGCQAQTGRPSGPNATAAGALSAVRNMTSMRAAHTSTLLGNGNVLIAGGFVGSGGSLSSTEVFNAADGAFSAGTAMNVARAGHTATLLPNGKVLIAGGYNGEYLRTTELYDPAAGRFAPAGKMVTPRSGHVAVLLKNGKVLLAGGVGIGWSFLSDAELYDPVSNTFTSTGPMREARESHTATLLRDGRVLVAGGHRGRRAEVTIYKSTEVYDPALGSFTAGPDLTVRRHKHDAVLLADGRVLVAGGSDERDGDGAYRNAEIFDPASSAVAAVPNNMNTTRYKLQGTAILLPNNKVLIAGGADRAEIFDPATDSFTFAEGDMGTKKLFAAATLLPNGHVLITGGYTDGNRVSSNAWIYSI